jgi:hypothetical protein
MVERGIDLRFPLKSKETLLIAEPKGFHTSWRSDKFLLFHDSIASSSLSFKGPLAPHQQETAKYLCGSGATRRQFRSASFSFEPQKGQGLKASLRPGILYLPPLKEQICVSRLVIGSLFNEKSVPFLVICNFIYISNNLYQEKLLEIQEFRQASAKS